MPANSLKPLSDKELYDGTIWIISEVLMTHYTEKTKMGDHRLQQFEKICTILDMLKIMEGLNLKQQRQIHTEISRLKKEIKKLNEPISKLSSLKKLTNEQEDFLQKLQTERNQHIEQKNKLIKCVYQAFQKNEEVTNLVNVIQQISKKISNLNSQGVLTKKQTDLVNALSNKRKTLIAKRNKLILPILEQREFKKEFNLSEDFKSQIIKGFWLDLRHQIKTKEYGSFLSKAISLVKNYGPDRSITYNKINELIGDITEKDEKESLAAYHAFNNHLTMIDQLKQKQMTFRKYEDNQNEPEVQKLKSKLNQLETERAHKNGEEAEKTTNQINDYKKKLGELNINLQSKLSTVMGLKKSKGEGPVHNTQPTLDTAKILASLPNEKMAKNFICKDDTDPYHYFKGVETYPDMNKQTVKLNSLDQEKMYEQGMRFLIFTKKEINEYGEKLAKTGKHELHHSLDVKNDISNQDVTNYKK